MRCAVVTGATGFVGRHIVKTLIEKGYRVSCPVRNKNKASDVLGEDVNIEWVDFSDINSIRNFLEETMNTPRICVRHVKVYPSGR